jgi:hypothetical protein
MNSLGPDFTPARLPDGAYAAFPLLYARGGVVVLGESECFLFRGTLSWPSTDHITGEANLAWLREMGVDAHFLVVLKNIYRNVACFRRAQGVEDVHYSRTQAIRSSILLRAVVLTIDDITVDIGDPKAFHGISPPVSVIIIAFVGRWIIYGGTEITAFGWWCPRLSRDHD